MQNRDRAQVAESVWRQKVNETASVNESGWRSGIDCMNGNGSVIENDNVVLGSGRRKEVLAGW